MFKVFTGDGRQYVGCSERLALRFYEDAKDSGRPVLMQRRDVRYSDEWEVVKEANAAISFLTNA